MSNKYRPAWSSSSSSLTSDRLSPKYAKNVGNKKSQAKGKDAAQAVQKSPRVRELEGILKRLKDNKLNERDPDSGCFCLARVHDLSPYTPMCPSCGLILCELNPPSSSCPFAPCSASLLSPSALSSLIARLEADIEETIRQEEEEEERKREVRRAQEGAFPMLANAGSSGQNAPPKQQQQTYKVLSLNSKTKKATMATYTPRSSTPATPSPASSVEVLPQAPPRVPPPVPSQVASQPIPQRPFMDMRKEAAIRLTYVPPSQQKRVDSGETLQPDSSSRGRGVGGRVVPGAEH